MYKFHIKGFASEDENSSYYWGSMPIDITVYADKLDDAMDKAQRVFGHYISTSQREIIIEEIPEW